MKKIQLLIIAGLLTLSCFAQEQPTHFGILGIKLEYQSHYNSPGGLFFGGYRFNNHYLGLDWHLPFKSGRSTPTAISLDYGYNIGVVQPYISGEYFSCGKEAISEKEGIKGFDMGLGVSYFPKEISFKFTLGINSIQSIKDLSNPGNHFIIGIGYYRCL